MIELIIDALHYVLYTMVVIVYCMPRLIIGDECFIEFLEVKIEPMAGTTCTSVCYLCKRAHALGFANELHYTLLQTTPLICETEPFEI